MRPDCVAGHDVYERGGVRTLISTTSRLIECVSLSLESAMAVRQPAADGRIIRNSRVLGGEPVVRGTRISVRSVVLASRECRGPEDVLEAYPQLTLEDVNESLAFYDAHRTEIDRYIRANLSDE